VSVGIVGDSRITNAVVTVPSWGVGYVDLALDAEVELTGLQTVTIADVSIVATVTSGGPSEGRSGYRLAFGHGGWGTVLPKKGYADDAGVKRATLIADAAGACGEVVTGATSERVGPHYARASGPASAVLPAGAWYVGFDGVTRLGAWPSSEYSGPATRTKTDPARGVITLTTDSLVGLVPGATVDVMQVVDVEYTLSPKSLTARVYGAPSGTSRRTEALRAAIELMFPSLRYSSTYEYRVVSQSGERLNLQPVRTVTGMPDLTRVPVRLAPGVKATHLPGSLVLVLFVDGDPARPVVISGDSPDSPGWMPTVLELGGPGALGVARIGDTVQAGPFAGVITSGSLRVKAVL